jgi:hypothetical protein
MIRFASIVAILIWATCVPAFAEIKGCYQVFYDAAVLKRNPNMQVTAVTLLVGVAPNDQEDFEDFVQFTLRNNKSGLGTAACSGGGGKQTCRLVDFKDGTKGARGRFTLTETKDGVKLSPVTDLSLWVGQGKTFKLDISGIPAHKVFTLKKKTVELESCGGD